MAYRLTVGSDVVRLFDGAFIPNDPENTDRTAYNNWLAEGGVPEPAPTLPPAPMPPLTARQLRLWLLSRGITRVAVAAVLATLPEPEQEAVEIEWEYSTQYLREHALIDQIGAAFDLTPKQIDAGWVEAAAL